MFYNGLLTALQLKLDGTANLARGPNFESTDFTELRRQTTASGVVVKAHAPLLCPERVQRMVRPEKSLARRLVAERRLLRVSKNHAATS